MRLARLMSVLAIPVVLIVGCSSSDGTIAATGARSATASPSAEPSPGPSPTSTQQPTGRPTPKPTKKPASAGTDPLTGGRLVNGPAIAAKIDNTGSGWPQYGVGEADIVYVEQVEGGLTRLLAVFHSKLPTEVGPIRSVRTTDAELLPAFGRPALAFSGGAGGPVAALAATPVVDASGEGSAYWRSDAASQPFNLHVDLQAISRAVHGLSQPKNIGFTFAASDPRVAAGPAATSVSVVFEAGSADFAFADGHYQVLRDGEAVSDAKGTPMVADNVLVQQVQSEPDGTVDSVGSPSYLSHTVGSGTFTLYRDGHAIPGTWSRTAADRPTEYVDGAGKPVPFKPGHTWVALATPSTLVSAT